MSIATEEKRFKEFMNKKPSNAQILSRIKKITTGKTPQSAKKFEVMKWILQNSPNETHYQISEAMFRMQSDSNTGFWNWRENEMVKKFNIPQKFVNRELSKFTPRKRNTAAPKTAAPKKAAPKKAAPKKAAPKKAAPKKAAPKKAAPEKERRKEWYELEEFRVTLKEAGRSDYKRCIDARKAAAAAGRKAVAARKAAAAAAAVAARKLAEARQLTIKREYADDKQLHLCDKVPRNQWSFM